MLKIRDGIDLKVLEKFPFECSDSGSIFWNNKDASKYIRVWFCSRKIQCNDENNHILKMLTKADLVEKVGND